MSMLFITKHKQIYTELSLEQTCSLWQAERSSC